jgi:hypothetical protein
MILRIGLNYLSNLEIVKKEKSTNNIQGMNNIPFALCVPVTPIFLKNPTELRLKYVKIVQQGD